MALMALKKTLPLPPLQSAAFDTGHCKPFLLSPGEGPGLPGGVMSALYQS